MLYVSALSYINSHVVLELSIRIWVLSHDSITRLLSHILAYRILIMSSSGVFPFSRKHNTNKSEDGRPQMPQAIAHRGYKAKYPENTMSAFSSAVEIGAHAVETDVHITKDGVVVLSHDNTLNRCFNRPEQIIDCDWSFIAPLLTTHRFIGISGSPEKSGYLGPAGYKTRQQ